MIFHQSLIKVQKKILQLNIDGFNVSKTKDTKNIDINVYRSMCCMSCVYYCTCSILPFWILFFFSYLFFLLRFILFWRFSLASSLMVFYTEHSFNTSTLLKKKQRDEFNLNERKGNKCTKQNAFFFFFFFFNIDRYRWKLQEKLIDPLYDRCID